MQIYSTLYAGNTSYAGVVDASLQPLPSHLSHYDCRNNQLLAFAYQQIKNDVEKLKYQYGSNRIAVILGTSTSGIAASESAFKHKKTQQHFPDNFKYTQQEIGTCANFLAEYAQVSGIKYTISTACSSSGKAIAAAKRLLESDLCDAVIVGGSDSLCELTLNGFNSLGLLSQRICNPFSANRDGINIGEGSALFILSKIPSGIRLIGVGESSDGYHMTAPEPHGKGGNFSHAKCN